MTSTDFDPISFLEIKDVGNRKKLTNELFTQISHYLTDRFIAILPTENLLHLASEKDVFAAAQKHFPDFHKKVKDFMIDFKKEFQTNYKS